MKILLLSGCVSRRVRFGEYARSAPAMQPYASLCLAGALKQKGYNDIKLVDTEVHDYSNSDVVKIVQEYRPDIVGVSVHSVTREYVTTLLQDIRKGYKDAVLVAGGPHVKLYPEAFVTEGVTDYCFSGEADFAFVEFVEALDRGRPVEDIQNLVYRKNGQTIRNPDRPLLTDLDQLPFPAFEMIYEDRFLYHPQLMTYRRKPWSLILTSRGCEYRCHFCPSCRMWARNEWRPHSADYSVRMIEYAKKVLGVQEVCFNDCSFAMSKPRVLEFSRLMRERNVNVLWSANVNLEGLDEEMLVAMKDCGCWLLSAGVETGSDDVMKAINKPLTVAQARKTIETIDKVGIRIRGYFMLGHLADTAETMRQTIDFSKSLPLYSANYSILAPIPGSDFHSELQMQEPGVEYCYTSWGRGHKDKLFVAKQFTEEYLMDTQAKAFREFFFRFIQVWRLLREMRSWEDVKRYFQMFLTGIEAFLGMLRKDSDRTADC